MSDATERWKERYEMVVGLEVHVHLKTATKIFCRCSTDFGAAPNANTCPVCLALPGALPCSTIARSSWRFERGLALGCTIESTVDLRAEELLLS
jgi:aspartyl-tRNA(Asn)/glutamyl-tRNA(Gln) amidotransferase subunit B